MTDHKVHINIYKHPRRKTRGIIPECETCDWSGQMRIEAAERFAIAEANDHVRKHRQKHRKR